MSSVTSRIMGTGSALLLALAGLGCQEEGPAEGAGRAIDEAVEDAGDQMEEAVEEAKEKMDP